MSISGYTLNKAAIFDRKQNNGTLMTMGKFVTSRAVYPVIVLTGLTEALPSALLSLVLRLPFYLFSSNRFSSLTNHTYDSLQSAKDAFIKIFTFYLAKAAKASAVVQTPVGQPRPTKEKPPAQPTPVTSEMPPRPSTKPAPVEEPPIEQSYFQSALDTVNNNPKTFLALTGLAAAAVALWYFDFAPQLTNGADAKPLPQLPPVQENPLLRIPDGSEKLASIPPSVFPQAERFDNSTCPLNFSTPNAQTDAPFIHEKVYRYLSAFKMSTVLTLGYCAMGVPPFLAPFATVATGYAYIPVREAVIQTVQSF